MSVERWKYWGHIDICRDGSIGGILMSVEIEVLGAY
jgi:hypothetical protein